MYLYYINYNTYFFPENVLFPGDKTKRFKHQFVLAEWHHFRLLCFFKPTTVKPKREKESRRCFLKGIKKMHK